VLLFTSIVAGKAGAIECIPLFHLDTVEGLRQTADCFDTLAVQHREDAYYKRKAEYYHAQAEAKAKEEAGPCSSTKQIHLLAQDTPETRRRLADCTEAQGRASYAADLRREAADWEAAAARKKKVIAVEAARKKKSGASIGMTAEEVKDGTSWGPPNHINRTITANGISEQWVYGGGYLYFNNGTLTAIQTSNSRP
jgi:phage protein D